MNSTDPRLAVDIIGGGASATLVLAHLARHKNAEKLEKITVYDREGRFARGIAYSTRNKLHLLNVRANNMSGFPADMTHLVRWLADKKYPYKETDFIPRMIYAKYLQGIWDEALKNLPCEIVFKQEDVGKDPKNSDIKIIATGNAFPYAPQGAAELTAGDGYHAHPWNIHYESIKGSVIIIGTGLSMVDTVMALWGAGFKGQITAISRNGLIPATHTDPAAYPCFYGQNFPETVSELLKDIRAHLGKAGEENIPWQAVIDSLRSVTNPVWLSWDEAQRNKAKRLTAFWSIHRHRMAPEAAKVIHEWKNSGQLTIVRDRVERVEKGPRVIGRKRIYEADHVINCLGYGRDPAFKYDYAQEKSGLYAIGPVLSGILFETVAIPEIRSQAERIANEILK